MQGMESNAVATPARFLLSKGPHRLETNLLTQQFDLGTVFESNPKYPDSISTCRTGIYIELRAHYPWTSSCYGRNYITPKI